MTHYPKQIIRLGVLTAWFVGAFITHAQDGALRDTAAGAARPGALGWMRGTATLADEPVGEAG